METLLQAREVFFERRMNSVFGTLNLAVSGGEAVLITGMNGAGKTTLLKVLAGILRPTAGHVERGPLCFVGHQTALKDDLTASENLRFYAALEGVNDVLSALDRFDARHLAHRSLAEMSAGQRRRVALSRLFLGQHPLWLLDEPYANLDQDGCARVDQALAHHQQQGGATVLASHGRSPLGLNGLRELRLPLAVHPVEEST